MNSLDLITRLIVKSNGRQTDAQLVNLSPAEQKRLAALLHGLGRGDLVTWDIAEPEDGEDVADRLNERDARAIAVDIGVKASRFAAAAALGEIEGMVRDTKDRRWFDCDKLLEWAELQVAGIDESNAEQQDDDDDPGYAQEYRKACWQVGAALAFYVACIAFTLWLGYYSFICSCR
ncbi:MAG: hypothetical protein M3R04_04590 [bacterium]|nr:hypothetical protein [bacterium]